VVRNGNEIMLTAKREDDLYYFDALCSGELALSLNADAGTLPKPNVMTTLLWHRRLGHLNFRGLAHLQTLVDGLKIGPIPDILVV
jgi:hypothetical protein